ncbi:hypothetical protein NDU88_001631 [Pleurodeles waltl]|uniref:Ig-like domain-containing protein n=2 Tax=Pleurodeles waltl TaxID=8319 RepID=A0AAV7KT59_PLEWA|nr:hypothetical protein NDU88_001631 [Pleurodeles waltl]
MINIHVINSAQKSDSGEYACKTTGSERSDPVKLAFSDDWIILQTSYSAVFKGEEMLLSCLGWTGYRVANVKYFKESSLIAIFSMPQALIIKNATVADSGTYHCKMKIKSGLFYSTYTSNIVAMTVKVPVFGVCLEVLPMGGHVIEEQRLQVNCSVKEGTVPIIFSWCKLNTDECIYKEVSDERWAEFVTPLVQERHTGDYYCKASNRGTASVKSPVTNITVHRIPVSGISVQIEPHGGKVVEEEKLVVTCTVSEGTGPVTFSWCRQDIDACLQQKTTFSRQVTFVMDSMMEEDDGLYYCTASNERAPIESEQIQIYVERTPVSEITLKVQPTGGKFTEGEKMILTCSVGAGTGPVTFSWCKMRTGNCVYEQTLNSRKVDYIVPSVTEIFEGAFYCRASNSRATVESELIQLSVKIPVSQPMLTFGLDGDRHVLGDTVMIHCESKRGTLPIVYQFYHQQRTLGKVFIHQKEPGRLKVTLASADDSGAYSCDASNDVSSDVQRSEELFLTVVVPVSGATLKIDKTSPEVPVDESLRFTCSLASGSLPEFHWFHDEKVVDETSGIYLLPAPGNSLFIESIQPEHGGNYQCHATNILNQNKTLNSTSNIITVSVVGLSIRERLAQKRIIEEQKQLAWFKSHQTLLETQLNMMYKLQNNMKLELQHLMNKVDHKLQCILQVLEQQGDTSCIPVSTPFSQENRMETRATAESERGSEL